MDSDKVERVLDKARDALETHGEISLALFATLDATEWSEVIGRLGEEYPGLRVQMVNPTKPVEPF